MVMDRELRFGVIALQNAPWGEMVERWQSIEELGFDSVWVADHFVDFSRPREPWFEAWTLLAGLATQTSRIRIGTLVTPTAWRNPAFLARMTMTVDHLSNGRLELGLGAGATGDIDCSYAMTGIEDWASGERVARFREAVEIIDRMLRNKVTTYEGRYYRVVESAMSPSPIQEPRPPITIGANGPRMLRIAARYADTWNTYGGMGLSAVEMLKATRERSAFLDECCEKIGRDPASLMRSLLLFGPPAEKAYSSEDGFSEVVEEYGDAGISEFIVYYPLRDEHLPCFERIAKEIIPELRDNAL
jgi:alkanesulfonate monooxygenase SsuD/methylene tetrahydromethanopterin reductase-like flavin-dependent oxidoreductase (luciferase family)